MQRSVTASSVVAGPSRSLHTSAPAAARANRYTTDRKTAKAAADAPIVKPPNAKLFNVRDYLPDSLVSPPLNNRKSAPTRKAAKLWLQNEGAQWKSPSEDARGPFWIGDTPFPTNDKFRPPVPLSNRVKSDIYARYKRGIASIQATDKDTRWSTVPAANPTEPPSHTALIRAIALDKAVAMDRVRAVVRLKALEERYPASTGRQLQAHFAEKMALILGVDPNDSRVATTEEAEATASAARSAGTVEFVDHEAGEQPIHDQLLQPTQTAKQRPPTALRSNELRVKREAKGKRDLVFADMADTTRGRAWERTNRNRNSRSAHAARAAELALLDRLGRLSQRAYTAAEADREAIAEHRKETPRCTSVSSDDDE